MWVGLDWHKQDLVNFYDLGVLLHAHVVLDNCCVRAMECMESFLTLQLIAQKLKVKSMESRIELEVCIHTHT